MEAEELKPQILAAIDDLNQYLLGNVTGLGLINTLKDTINDVEAYALTIRENKTMENLNEGKKPKGYMAELAEIDAQSAIVAMEAKINKLEEMATAKEQRLSMVSEDENLSELISKSAVKEMQKEIKEIRKMQEKLKKVYEKKNGKKMPKMVDEEDKKMDEANNPKDGDTGVEDLSGVLGNYLDEGDKEIDEAHCNTEEDDVNVKEETNEEVSRWQKLAGIPIFEQKKNINEIFNYAGLERDYMWFSDKNLGNNKAKADSLMNDLTDLRLQGYDEPFDLEKYKEYVKRKLGSNQEKYDNWLKTLPKEKK